MSAVFALFLPHAVRLDPWKMVGDALGNRDTEIVATLPLVLTADHASALYGVGASDDHRLDAAALGLDQSVALLLRARRPDGAPRDRLTELAAQTGLPIVLLPDHGGPFLPPGAATAMLVRGADRTTRFTDLALLRPYVALRDEPNQVDLLMRTLQRILAVLCHDARLVPFAEAHAALDAASHLRTEVAVVNGVAARETALHGLHSLRRLIEAIPEPRARVVADDVAPALAALAADRRTLRRLALRLADPASLNPWEADDVLRALAGNDVFLDRWERHRLSLLCGFFQS